jgi:hypothetical protein
MTPERALALWKTRTPGGGTNATPEERLYVTEVWRGMSSNSSWIATLLAIANGEVNAKGAHDVAATT